MTNEELTALEDKWEDKIRHGAYHDLGHLFPELIEDFLKVVASHKGCNDQSFSSGDYYRALAEGRSVWTGPK